MKTYINDATLRLFKSVYVEKGDIVITEDEMVDLASKGLMFAPGIIFDSNEDKDRTIKSAISLYGIDLISLSQTFHKTWKTVKEIDPALHYMQEILHYITTYGFESLGIKPDVNYTYIPEEKIPYPENIKPYNFTIIRPIHLEELADRLGKLLVSGVALNQQQIDDVILLLDYMDELGYSFEFNLIKNKEIRAILWTRMKNKTYITVDEFLRVLTYLVSNSSLLVRSYRNHEIIKLHLKYDKMKQDKVKTLFDYYINKWGIENIASQFLRNKMVFLSFKCDTTKHIINKIRRAANKYHKPLQERHLLADDIYEANIWQLVKYYNFCQSSLNPTADKVYQIRNGKNYLAENKNYGLTGGIKRVVDEHYTGLKNIIEGEIVKKLSHLKNKIFIIPDYIDYKVPSSLKRLASGVPEGSVITFPENTPITIGIHWINNLVKNVEQRVDLDIHANSLTGQLGWYSSYRNDDAMYSGDITDAKISKGGASEAFTFYNKDTSYIVTLNDYTMHTHKTPYKLVFDLDTQISSNEVRHEARGYIFSPNAKALNSSICLSQNTLGLVTGNKFYFMNSSMFSGPITTRSEFIPRLINYYNAAQDNILSFRKLSELIGFRIVPSKDDIEVEEGQEPEIIDLSLEAITEDTFPNLFITTEE